MSDTVAEHAAAERRLAALQAAGCADATPLEPFDRLAALAARALDAPAAALALLGAEGLLLKGAAGFGEPLASSRVAPAAAWAAAREPLALADARADARFRDDAAAQSLGAVALASRPVVADDGTVLGALVALDRAPREWSERDRAVLAALAELASDEVRRLTEARAQIEIAETLREAVSARDELMAVLAHDMRSLLQGVSLSAQLLEMQPGEVELAQAVSRSVGKLTELVKRLLDLKSLRVRGLVAPEPTAPRELLDAARTAFAARSAREGVPIELACPELPDVLADRERVRQVLENLIANALRHGRKGGAIALSATRRAGWVRFEVKDGGGGIPAHLQADLFERFWRHRTGPGLAVGLGLSIVKTIVQAHGGEVGVESEPGGARFWFTLPEAPPGAAEPGARQGGSSAQPGRARG